MQELYHSEGEIKGRKILSKNDHFLCINKGGCIKWCFISAGITYIIHGLLSSDKFCSISGTAVNEP